MVDLNLLKSLALGFQKMTILGVQIGINSKLKKLFELLFLRV